jgi:hypothetical protein
MEELFEKIRNQSKSFDYSIDIEDKRIKKYKGLTSIIFDLSFVRECLILLVDSKTNKVSNTIERGLFISSIVTYSRCFTQAKGRGTRLDSKNIFNSEEIKLHEYLMNLRNEYIAHAGTSDGERIYASANFSLVQGANEVDIRIGYEVFGQVGLSKDQINSFVILLDQLIINLANQREIEVKAYLSFLTSNEKNEMLKRAIYKRIEQKGDL